MCKSPKKVCGKRRGGIWVDYHRCFFYKTPFLCHNFSGTCTANFGEKPAVLRSLNNGSSTYIQDPRSELGRASKFQVPNFDVHPSSNFRTSSCIQDRNSERQRASKIVHRANEELHRASKIEVPNFAKVPSSMKIPIVDRKVRPLIITHVDFFLNV